MKKTILLSTLERDKRRDSLRERQEKRDSDPKFLETKAWVQEIFKGDYEKLAAFAARSVMQESTLLKENEELCEKLNEVYRTAGYLSESNPIESHIKTNIALMSLEMNPDNPVAKTYQQVIQKERQATKRAKTAADARFNKPGGSREKKAAILAMWASGKYSSRDICAEQECSVLGMSFSTARKALIGTANPT